MPKLISVHTESELLECPPQWNMYKGVPVECSIYESESKYPGKRWFYIFDDEGDTVSYFHCSPGDASYSDDGSTITFDTRSGSHYVIRLGKEQPKSYKPYLVIGHGNAAIIVGGTAFENEIAELENALGAED